MVGLNLLPEAIVEIPVQFRCTVEFVAFFCQKKTHRVECLFIFKFYGGQLKNINDKTHVDKLHDIKLKNGSKRSVCSYHEFVCSKRLIPNDLEVWATASDGTIEAIEHKSHRVMGMQWHPERKYPSASEDINIIKAFFNIDD